MKRDVLKRILSLGMSTAFVLSYSAMPATAQTKYASESVLFEEEVSELEEPELTAEPIPEGAIEVSGLVTNATGSRTITTENGAKKTVAASNTDNSIYYIGDYDISKIEEMAIKASLIERKISDDSTQASQIKFAYMDIADGDEINVDYLTENSSIIRNAAHKIGTISGTTEYTVNESNAAADYSGAVYTIGENGVSVDADTYAVYPGGTATVDSANSSALKTSVTGEKHLFVYATASKGRAVMEYVNITLKEEEPTQKPEEPEEPKTPSIVIGEITKDGTNATVNVSIENPTEETKDVCIVVAVFDENGKFVQAKTAENGTAIVNNTENGAVKVFVWDGTSSMKPILSVAQKAL